MCSVYEALAAELVRPLGCVSCTLDAGMVAVLNDKIKFTAFCERHGLRVPRSFPVTSRERLFTLNSRSHLASICYTWALFMALAVKHVNIVPTESFI